MDTIVATTFVTNFANNVHQFELKSQIYFLPVSNHDQITCIRHLIDFMSLIKGCIFHYMVIPTFVLFTFIGRCQNAK